MSEGRASIAVPVYESSRRRGVLGAWFSFRALVVLAAIVLAGTRSAAAQSGLWTWRGGPDIAAQLGTYGTQGTADPANIPGARDGAATWRDSSGNLWLFGGVGYGTTSFGDLNDLWKWDGTAWTWVSGSDEAEQFGTYGTKGVPDSLNVPGAREGAVSWIDASGNLWLFGGYGNSSVDKLYLNDLWKWDGTNWTWVSGSDLSFQPGIYGTQGVANPANVPGARYFPNSGIDAAGHFWLFGGFGVSSSDAGSLNDLWKWDGANWTWMSGSDVAGQLGTYGTKGVASPSNVPGARYFATFWSDPTGNLWLFGGNGNSATTSGYLNDLWKWNGTAWTWVSGSDAAEQAGTWGTKGVASLGSVPSARSAATPFRDAAGKLWLFGGEGLSTGAPGYLNDLWRWDGTFWTWVSGTNLPDEAGTYGTQGVPAAANVPGSRASAASWNSGATTRITMFGGYGFDSAAVIDDLNDLWTFEVPSCSPPPASVTAPGAVCAASSGNPASVADAGAGATYAWTVTGGTIGSGNGTRTITFSPTVGSTSVTLSVIVTIPGGCATEGSTVVTVNPAPPAPTAGNGGAVCAGGTISLTASTVPGATYAWTGPNGYTSPAQNPTIPNATTAMSGTYSVTATVGGCTSPAGTTVVTVNAAPPAPTAGNGGAVCAGGTISLTASTVPGATYAWTGPNGFTSSAQNPTIPNATTAMSGTYSVTATVSGCPSPAATTVVTVNAIPPAPTAASNSPVCSGNTIALTTPTVAGATYAWTGPNGFTSSAQNPTIPNAAAANAGTYSVTITVNGCPSSAGSTVVAVNATPPAPTAGNGGAICAGGTISLTASTVPGATYAWTGPNGFTSSAQNPTIPNATTAMSGTYSVTATVNGCPSPAGTTVVTVNAIPPAPTAGNGGAVCTGGTISLTASTVPGATYSWTGPNGFTSAVQNPTIPNATAANAGTYSVTATVNNCTSPAGTTVVTVNTTPATPTASSNSPVCSGSTIALSTPAVSGATYAWTGPNGFTSSLQNPTIPNATAANAGTYTVTVTGSGCVSGAGSTDVVVNATPAAPTAGNGGPYTPGQTISLTASTVPGATYSWTGPNGFTSSLQNPTRPNATTADAGVYSVTVTVGTCTSQAATTTVVVNNLVWVLTVTKLGAGAGQVTSNPAGINCGGTCTFSFPDATPIVLTATADPGSNFVGWSGGGCSGTGTCTVTISAATTVSASFVPDGALSFYTVAPCRVLDTRDAAGPFGGPALIAGTARAFQIAGSCGIPADAVAVSINVTVTGATSGGSLTVYPGIGPGPITTTVNFVAGRTRANNAILGLIGGYLTAQDSQTSGTVDFILDVNGYFR